jgi:hypothetical protein
VPQGYTRTPLTPPLSLPVRAAAVRGRMPEEKDRDRECARVFSVKSHLVAPTHKGPDHARHHLSASRRANARLRKSLPVLYKRVRCRRSRARPGSVSFRGGGEELLTVRDQVEAPPGDLQRGRPVCEPEPGSGGRSQAQPAQPFSVGAKELEHWSEQAAGAGGEGAPEPLLERIPGAGGFWSSAHRTEVYG